MAAHTPVKKPIAALAPAPSCVGLEGRLPPAGVGAVRETSKWGQPSYLPVKPRVGSTLRLGQVGEDVAMFFHCQTTLVEEFRVTWGDRLRYQGRRALLWRVDEAIPADVVKACATAALRYHVRRRGPG